MYCGLLCAKMNGYLCPEQFAKQPPKFSPTSFSKSHHHLYEGVIPDGDLSKIVSEAITYFQPGKVKEGCTIFYLISHESSGEKEAHHKIFIARSGSGQKLFKQVSILNTNLATTICSNV